MTEELVFLTNTDAGRITGQNCNGKDGNQSQRTEQEGPAAPGLCHRLVGLRTFNVFGHGFNYILTGYGTSRRFPWGNGAEITPVTF